MFMLVEGKARFITGQTSNQVRKGRLKDQVQGLICKEHNAGLSDDLVVQIADNHAALEHEPEAGAGQHSS